MSHSGHGGLHGLRSALNSLRRKAVYIGIDIGTDYIRACVWSSTRQRPEALVLGCTLQTVSGNGDGHCEETAGENVLLKKHNHNRHHHHNQNCENSFPGPGGAFSECNYGLASSSEEEAERKEAIRAAFVSHCALAFARVRCAVSDHYHKDQEHLLFAGVVVSCPIAENYYHIALQDAAAKSALELDEFRIKCFLSPPLAACIGKWAYERREHAPGYDHYESPAHSSASGSKSSNILVIDIGSGATKVGVVEYCPRDNERGPRFRVLNSLGSSLVTVDTFVKAVADGLCKSRRVNLGSSLSSSFSSSSTDSSDGDDSIAQATQFCKEVSAAAKLAAKTMSGPASSATVLDAQKLEWYKRVTASSYKKLEQMIQVVVKTCGGSIHELVLLGGGVQLPRIYRTVCSAIKEGAASVAGAGAAGLDAAVRFPKDKILFPVWTKSLHVVAMGAAVRAGMFNDDKHHPVELVSETTCNPYYLQLLYGKHENTTKGLLAVAPRATFPVKSSFNVDWTNGDGCDLGAICLMENEAVGLGHSVKQRVIARISFEEHESDQPKEKTWGGTGGEDESRIFYTAQQRREGARAIGKLEVHVDVGGQQPENTVLRVTKPSLLRARCSARMYHDRLVREAFMLANKQRAEGVTLSGTAKRPSLLRKNASQVIQTVSSVFLLIEQADGLARADGPFRKSDPYCVALLNGERIGQTPVIRRTLNPKWHYKLSLSVPGHVITEHDQLALDVYDHDLLSADDFLGRAEISGADIISADRSTRWYKLGFRQDLSSKKQKLVKGKIAVHFESSQFHLTESMVDFHQHSPKKQVGQGTTSASTPFTATPARAKTASTSPATSSGKSPRSPFGPGGLSKAKLAAENRDPGTYFEQDGDLSDSEDEAEEDDLVDVVKMDPKRRWRIITGNVPVHGFTVEKPSCLPPSPPSYV